MHHDVEGAVSGIPAARAPDAEVDVLGSLDELPDGLVVAGPDGTVRAFNAAAARITGLPADAVLGRDIRTALALQDLDGRSWWAVTDPWHGLASRTRQPERPVLLTDGTEVLATATYVRSDAPGRPLVRLVLALRDTLARSRAEERSSDLVSAAAHELRSPLTSVKGFTATLLAKWDRFTDEQRQLMLQTVDADADRVTRLITEMLDIARIDSGRLEMRRQVIDVPAAATRNVSGLVAAGQPEEKFRVSCVGELPEMWLDPDKIDQVLRNLLENAVRHGDGRVSIEIEPATPAQLADLALAGVVPSDGGVAVSISDEGEGIPPELATRVFTKHWRGGRRGGTGLGLYIVRGIVEAHGGRVTVGRSPSGGALFRFVLPAGAPQFLG